MDFRTKASKLLALATLLSAVSCKTNLSSTYDDLELPETDSHAELAIELRKEGHFEKAIKHYEIHMERRIKSDTRPKDENPYFYYVLIGSTYLEMDRPEEALDAYEKAYENNVEAPLIIDGVLRIARSYEKEKKFEKGIDVLTKYRDLDPLVIDLDIDRLHKGMIAAENDR